MTIPMFARDLAGRTDHEWFSAMCDWLRRERRPTTRDTMQWLGVPRTTPPCGQRGSLFLAPYDPRFSTIAINPDLDEGDTDAPLDRVSIQGLDFSLRLADVVPQFPLYRVQSNDYDGGTQVFFHPVSPEYEFSAVSVWTELETVRDPLALVVHNVTFVFGTHLVTLRDGLTMLRLP